MNRAARLLRALNCDAAYGWALLGACALLLLITLTGETGRELLRYDRAALAHGELWRLVTAHLVHLDLHHLLLNCLGLLLVWALFARDYTPWQWAAIVLASIAAIDAGLWFEDSTLRWYVGSSGALHGVMAAGALARLRRGEIEGWVLAAFLAGKLAWGHWMGALPVSAGLPVVTEAHVYGVLGGLAVAAFLKGAPKPL
ncbi:MAG TPA: rhombosortase [Steroidobacteraceae bacterium]|nr:rhombosortase [Steroidobacteraceae bacterium]